MNPLPTIEQERMAKGYTELLRAVEKLIKAGNDYKLNPNSKSFKNAYRDAYNKLREVGNKEYKYLNTIQNTLFSGKEKVQ